MLAEASQKTDALRRFLADGVNVIRPGQGFVQDNAKVLEALYLRKRAAVQGDIDWSFLHTL